MDPEEEKIKAPLAQVLKPAKSLRTYQGDVEEAISKNNYSSSDIFLAEQNRKLGKREENVIPQNLERRNKLYVTLGAVFFALGIITIGFVYYLRSNEKVLMEQRTKTLVGFSQEKILLIATTTREKFINQLLEEKSSFSLPVNSVLYVNTVDGNNSPENIERMLSLLAPKMPNSLTRSFSEKYMFGIFSFDTNEPFIILTTDDFALSFAGMLKWEKDLVNDLGKLFSITTNASSTLTFIDQERRNEDLRVLKDENGKIVLLYTFIDNNTLLITKNENVFNAILSKYLISQQEK